MCTFVTLTTLMRGQQLATPAGFFFVPAKGAFSTYKRRPAFTEPVLTGITRASGVVSSGTVRAAFLFRTSANYTHHAKRNSHPVRKGAPYYPRPHRRTGQAAHSGVAQAAPGISSKGEAYPTGRRSADLQTGATVSRPITSHNFSISSTYAMRNGVKR